MVPMKTRKYLYRRTRHGIKLDRKVNEFQTYSIFLKNCVLLWGSQFQDKVQFSYLRDITLQIFMEFELSFYYARL